MRFTCCGEYISHVRNLFGNYVAAVQCASGVFEQTQSYNTHIEYIFNYINSNEIFIILTKICM